MIVSTCLLVTMAESISVDEEEVSGFNEEIVEVTSVGDADNVSLAVKGSKGEKGKEKLVHAEEPATAVENNGFKQLATKPFEVEIISHVHDYHLVKLHWTSEINWELKKNKTAKLKDRYLNVDHKYELNISTKNYVEVPCNLLFKYPIEIQYESLIENIENYLQKLKYTCQKSAISGGNNITLESAPFTYQGAFTTLSIPVKMYRNSRKIMVQGGKIAIDKWLEHQEAISEQLSLSLNKSTSSNTSNPDDQIDSFTKPSTPAVEQLSART